MTELTNTEARHLAKIGGVERMWPDKPNRTRYEDWLMGAVAGAIIVALGYRWGWWL